MVKIDNTKIRRGDKVLIRSAYRSWFGDEHKPTFREEEVVKVTASSIYTKYENIKTRYPFRKTSPLVTDDFLGGVQTLFRNKEEYDFYTKQKSEQREKSNIDLLKGYTEDLNILYKEVSTMDTVDVEYISELNAWLGKALAIKPKVTGK